MKTIHYSLQDGIATLLFDEPNSAVNTMCQQWKDDLTAVVQQVLADRPQLKGIVLALWPGLYVTVRSAWEEYLFDTQAMQMFGGFVLVLLGALFTYLGLVLA